MHNLICLIGAFVILTGCTTYSERVTVESCVEWQLRQGEHRGEVVFLLTNLTSDYLAIFERDTPFNVGDDGILNGDVLTVRSADKRLIPYCGRLVLYVATPPEAIMTLVPHENKCIRLQIARSYEIRSHKMLEVGMAADDVFLMRFKDENKLRKWMNRVSSAEDFRIAAKCAVAPIRIKM